MCVWDLYKDELQQYEDRVQALVSCAGFWLPVVREAQWRCLDEPVGATLSLILTARQAAADNRYWGSPLLPRSLDAALGDGPTQRP